MRARVVAALVCLVAAKGALVFVPVFYKEAVDALTTDVDIAIALPVAMILGYGIARVLSLVFGELHSGCLRSVVVCQIDLVEICLPTCL